MTPSNPEFFLIVSVLLATSMLMLFGSGLLFVLGSKLGQKQYQKYWAYSWLVLGTYVLLGATSLYLRIFDLAGKETLDWLSFGSQVSGYLGPSLLYLGSKIMLGKQVGRFELFIWVGFACTVSALISFNFTQPHEVVERYVTRVGVRSAYSMIVMAYVAYLTLGFFKGENKSGPKIFSYALLIYASSWAVYVVSAVDMAFGGSIYKYVSIVGILGAFIQAIIIYGFLIWAIEIEQEKVRVAQEKLKDQALHDGLTGLFNRHWLEHHCPKWLEEHVISGNPITVMFVDLDGFKLVNDQHGHKIGDHLLKKVALTLSQHLSNTNVLCRLGGDEFLLVCTEFSTPGQVLTRANQIRESIHCISQIDGYSINISCSIGISMAKNTQDLSDLTQSSDQAMYTAKMQGKNKVQFATTYF